MKTLHCMAGVTVPLLAPGVSFAQTGNMMGGGMGDWMGGYGGIWPILLVIVVVGLVVWVVMQKGK